jgi:AsmA protein
MKRKVLISGVILAAVFVLVAVILPLLFDANRYRPDIETRLSQSLGRQVKIGSLKLAIFSGGIKADNISIADDPAFSREPFVKAKSLEVGVQMKPLFFDRQVKIESLVLDNPEVRLLQSASGKWNYSSLGRKQAKSPSKSSTSVEVKKLEISNGRMEVGRANGKQVAFTNVYMKASDISEKSSFPFSVSARAPNGGELRVDGKAGPVNNSDTSLTPFSGDLKISNLDLAAIGMMGSDSSIGGLLDYTGKIVSDGRKITSDGTATAVKLRLVRGAGVAKDPVQVQYHSSYDLVSEQGAIERTSIQTGKSTANLAGTFAAQGSTTNLNLNLSADKMNVADIEGLLPAFGIVLPAGSTLQGGTVNANLNIRGPLEKLVTTGTVNIADTKLTGFSLGKGLSAVASLAGLPITSDTTIQTLSSNLRVAPEGITADNLLLAVPELGTVTGDGTIAANSALDFHLVAKLANGGGAIGALTQLAGIKGGFKELPFAVKGTTSKPVFIPEIGSALTGTAASGSQTGQQQPANPVGSILQLFGKKKK